MGLLRGGHAHTDFDELVAEFPPEAKNDTAPNVPAPKPPAPKAPYTPWELLEHGGIA